MNLANKITLFRVFLVPVFVLIIYLDIPYNNIIAAFIFIIAAITDTLDGYIARSRNLVTNFGKFVDPLADKILVAAAFICLVEIGKVPAWAVVVVISREFIITGYRILAASEGVTIAASSLGKFKTIFQLIAIPLLLVDNYPFSISGIPIDMILLYISVFFTIISGFDYIYKNRNTVRLNIK